MTGIVFVACSQNHGNYGENHVWNCIFSKIKLFSNLELKVYKICQTVPPIEKMTTIETESFPIILYLETPQSMMTIENINLAQ